MHHRTVSMCTQKIHLKVYGRIGQTLIMQNLRSFHTNFPFISWLNKDNPLVSGYPVCEANSLLKHTAATLMWRQHANGDATARETSISTVKGHGAATF